MYKNNFDNLNDIIKNVIIDNNIYNNVNYNTCKKSLDFGENTKTVIKIMENYIYLLEVSGFNVYYTNQNGKKCNLTDLQKYYYRYKFIVKSYQYFKNNIEYVKHFTYDYMTDKELKNRKGIKEYKSAGRYIKNKIYIIDKLDRKVLKVFE